MTFEKTPTYIYHFKSEDRAHCFIEAVSKQFPDVFVSAEIQDPSSVIVKGTSSMNYNLYLQSELEALSKQL